MIIDIIDHVEKKIESNLLWNNGWGEFSLSLRKRILGYSIPPCVVYSKLTPSHMADHMCFMAEKISSTTSCDAKIYALPY